MSHRLPVLSNAAQHRHSGRQNRQPVGIPTGEAEMPEGIPNGSAVGLRDHREQAEGLRAYDWLMGQFAPHSLCINLTLSFRNDWVYSIWWPMVMGDS